MAKLDRLARNVAFISTLMESGVDFEALDLPQANKFTVHTQANKFTVHTVAAMEEHEASAISARTKGALAAKARGTRQGGHR